MECPGTLDHDRVLQQDVADDEFAEVADAVPNSTGTKLLQQSQVISPRNSAGRPTVRTAPMNSWRPHALPTLKRQASLGAPESDALIASVALFTSTTDSLHDPADRARAGR